MSGAEILTYLERRSVRLRLAGSELEIDAPESALTPDLVERIRARKAELLDFLKSAIEQTDWRADCAELFAEARAQVAINLANGACPDCSGGLIQNQLGEETLWYCQACDFTYSAADFEEIRSHLNRRREQTARKEAA